MNLKSIKSIALISVLTLMLCGSCIFEIAIALGQSKTQIYLRDHGVDAQGTFVKLEGHQSGGGRGGSSTDYYLTYQFYPSPVGSIIDSDPITDTDEVTFGDHLQYIRANPGDLVPVRYDPLNPKVHVQYIDGPKSDWQFFLDDIGLSWAITIVAGAIFVTVLIFFRGFMARLIERYVREFVGAPNPSG